MQIYRFCIYLLLLILSHTKYMPHNIQGFVCQDPTLSRVFTTDTVQPKVLLIGTFLGAFILIALLDFLVEKDIKKINFRDVWTKYSDFATSAVLVLLVVDVLKVLVGEPRPHFLTDCRPYENEDCVPGDYVSKFTCSNVEWGRLHLSDLSKSFPSGHSALSVFTGLYFITFLRFRLCDTKNRTSKLVLVLLLTTWSLLCTVSRITDNKHHWWDVLGGVAIGIFFSKYKTSRIIELANISSKINS